MKTNQVQRFKLEIERAKLHKLAEEYGFADERVIKQSQQLDIYLNQYRHLQKDQLV